MRTALIGSTGFVGSSLLRQTSFTHQFHSKTIELIAGQSFDFVVCCGAPAEKWRANQDPEADWNNIQRLIGSLKTARAKRMVLVSTVDVFVSPRGVDEDAPVELESLAAYGKHRYLLEQFAVRSFDALVVRLPGLFGFGLKKNVIYDFLHSNQLGRIPSDGVFQFYDLENLWRDVEIAAAAGISLLHVATEPVSVGEIAREVFGFSFHNRTSGPPAHYDFHSKHAAHFGGRDGYLYSRSAVLDAMRDFVNATREQKRCA